MGSVTHTRGTMEEQHSASLPMPRAKCRFFMGKGCTKKDCRFVHCEPSSSASRAPSEMCCRVCGTGNEGEESTPWSRESTLCHQCALQDASYPPCDMSCPTCAPAIAADLRHIRASTFTLWRGGARRCWLMRRWAERKVRRFEQFRMRRHLLQLHSNASSEDKCHTTDEYRCGAVDEKPQVAATPQEAEKLTRFLASHSSRRRAAIVDKPKERSLPEPMAPQQDEPVVPQQDEPVVPQQEEGEFPCIMQQGKAPA